MKHELVVRVTGSGPTLEPLIDPQPAVGAGRALPADVEALVVRQLAEALAADYRRDRVPRVGSAA